MLLRIGSRHCVLLVWAISFLCLSASSNVAVAAAAAAPQTENNNNNNINGLAKNPAPISNKSEKELEVIQLTSRNFSRTLSSASRDTVWLIEFYSPHCGHCVDFAPTYSDIARIYHSDDQDSSTTTTKKKKNIKVAKVNGDVERALTSRFGIFAYPSFFLVDGFSAYEFDQPRMRKMLMAFAEGGYKEKDPIPFYSSPMGPMGLLQGLLIFCGLLLHDLFQWTQSTFGLSPLLVGMILFGSIFLGCFFFIVFLALIIPPKVKRD